MQETGFNERERIARQLESIEGRYEELSIRITLPEVISDTPLFTRLMREHSELSELNDIAVRLQKAARAISEDAKEMLSDPDMAELARAEIDELNENNRRMRPRSAHRAAAKGSGRSEKRRFSKSAPARAATRRGCSARS